MNTTKKHYVRTTDTPREAFKDSVDAAVPPAGVAVWFRSIGGRDYVSVGADPAQWDAADQFMDQHLKAPYWTT